MIVRVRGAIVRRIGATSFLVSAALIAVSTLPVRASAQFRRDKGVDWQVEAGGEGERYLRALQLVGDVPLHPWALRAFSPRELATLSPRSAAHPWSSVLSLAAPKSNHVRILAPELTAIVNTGFAYGANDGPTWAGRGLTTVLRGGARASAGPVDLVLAPHIFRAENASFVLQPNGLSGEFVFADGKQPRFIDLPQRFGDGAYQRLDPGESSIRLSLAGFSAGFTTESEWWGPAVEHPFLLGSNGGGFPHFAIGTSHPRKVGPARVQFRVIGGSLQQSAFVMDAVAGRSRSIAGFVTTVGLGFVPGLEVGVGRLFENNVSDSAGGLSVVLRSLFKNPLKASRAQTLGTGSGDEPDNQLASAFFRWVFPASGVEVYGEFGREDNSYDLRDFIHEPDHSAMFMLGFGRGWKRPNRSVVVLRAEMIDSRVSHLGMLRGEGVPYTHSAVIQGHTQRGQVLGSPDAYGGGGAFLSIEEMSPRGRRSIRLSRALRGEQLPFQLASARPADVIHAIGGEWLTFHGRVDVTREVVAAYELNRDFGRDAFNLRAAVRARAHW